MDGVQRRVSKIIKRVKKFSCSHRLADLGCNTFLKKKKKNEKDLIKTLKITNGIFNHGRHIFSVSWTGNLLLWQISITKMVK